MTLAIIAVAIFIIGILCGVGLAVAMANMIPGNDKDDVYQNSNNWGAK